MRVAKTKFLLNPIVINTLLWLFVYALYKIPVVSFYEPASNAIVFFTLGVISFFAIGGMFAVLFRKKAHNQKITTNPHKLREFSNKLIGIWVIGFCIEIIYCGGFPSLWLLLRINKYYQDFGIPTIHGLLMAMFYLSCLLSYWELFNTRKKAAIFRVIYHLIIPILFVSRASILFTIIPLGVMYMFYEKLTLSLLIKVLAGIAVVLAVFYYLGVARGGLDLDLITDKKDQFQLIMDERVAEKEWLYPLVPIYIYVTESMNNINYNLKILQPNYYPYYSVVSLFPTFIRNIVYDVENTEYEDKYGLELANPAFNTFTMYGGILKDFGLPGVFAYCFIFGFLSMTFYAGVRMNSTVDLLCMLIIFIPLILAPFWDYLTSWVIMAQILILRKFGRRYFETTTNI